MAAKYVLFIGRDGQYYFSLHAANGERILQSEGYQRKAGALNGIDSCRRHSPYDQYYVRLGVAPGCWFQLKATNGEVIGRSETYSSNAAREVGIASVKVNGSTSTVDDRTHLPA